MCPLSRRDFRRVYQILGSDNIHDMSMREASRVGIIQLRSLFLVERFSVLASALRSEREPCPPHLLS
jgi:hypothetical protein